MCLEVRAQVTDVAWEEDMEEAGGRALEEDAGGNIIKSSDFEEIEVNRGKAKVIQSKNTVGGDMAGGNIVKKE